LSVGGSALAERLIERDDGLNDAGRRLFMAETD
jgi:hypothetical protein